MPYGRPIGMGTGALLGGLGGLAATPVLGPAAPFVGASLGMGIGGETGAALTPPPPPVGAPPIPPMAAKPPFKPPSLQEGLMGPTPGQNAVLGRPFVGGIRG